jgi:cytochrome c oxidase assembly protein subunit 15
MALVADCNGAWWPVHWETLKTALNVLVHPLQVNYQGGVLKHESRVVIQVIHRWGALITTLYSVIVLGLLWFKVKVFYWRALAAWTLLLLTIQVTLGVLNVIYYLPLPIAVMHNVVAVLLFSTWGVMWYESDCSA